MSKQRTVPLLESQTPTLEAVTLSLEEIGEKIRALLNPPSSMAPGEAEGPYCWVRATYDDRVIVEKAGKLWEVAYAVDEAGAVTLGAPAEVVVSYTKIAESGALTVTYEPVTPAVEISETSGVVLGLTEAKDGRPKGVAWDVLLIKAGTSGNRRHYPVAVLETAVPLFEGARAYADHPTKDEQRNRPERSIRDVVGWFEGVRWDTDEQGIRGTFRVLESVDWLRSALMSAWDAGKRDLLGFSINAMGRVGGKRADGSTLIEAIDSVVSTDVVTTPGAGGRLLGVLESERSSGTGPEGEMDPEEIKRLIAEAMAAGLTGLQTQLSETLTAQVATAVATLQPTAPVTEAEPPPPALDPAAVALQEAQSVLAEIKRQGRIVAISARIDAAKLPAAHTTKLKARLLEAAGRRDVDDTEVDAEIGYVREIIAESGVARPSWAGMTVAAGDSHHDKLVKAITGWFEGAPVDGVPPIRDLRESYGLWTGQAYMDVDPFEMFASFGRRYDSGRDHDRILESLATTDWGQVFADVFYIQMIKDYAASPDYDKWRMIVSDIESVSDFRTRHWSRIGGYGDLATVAEGITYPALTSPGDEEISYAIAKRGGIDDITMEMVLGDRLQTVRRLPRLMAYASSRTLYKFVFDMVTINNAVMDYDSVALYNSAHANQDTVALSVAGLSGVKVAMRSQTAFGQSQEILGTRNAPKILIVPNELEDRANRIINPSDAYAAALAATFDTNTELDPHMFKGTGLQVHVYDQLTNAKDWWVVADPRQVPTIVMGFLNGRTEPELFTQDQPNVGSAFTADKIAYKVRHVFGGDVQEHRSFYYNDVA